MSATPSSDWTEFWFRPTPIQSLRRVRQALCAVTAVYFAAAIGDVPTWLTGDGPATSSRLADFFRAAELTTDARWMLSPLYAWDALFAGSSLAESTTVYRTYLLLGIALAVGVACADQIAAKMRSALVSRLLEGSVPVVLLWIWFIGWANRIVLLAGIVEPLLSISLAALAIAPIGLAGDGCSISWRTRLATRLLAVQATLIAVATTATMIASPTWWNGTGAYAVVAPVEDRFFDVRESFFENAWIYESASLLLVVLLPLGVFLGWRPTTRRSGIVLIAVWAILVALLSANVLYAATLGIIATTLGKGDISHAPAGANGANPLNGGSMASAS